MFNGTAVYHERAVPNHHIYASAFMFDIKQKEFRLSCNVLTPDSVVKKNINKDSSDYIIA